MQGNYKPKKYMKRCDNPKCPNRLMVFEKRSMYHEDSLDFCTLSCLGDYDKYSDEERNRMYSFDDRGY